MWLRALPLAALVLPFAACHSKEAPAPALSATLAEAPAPAALVAELSIGNPKQTWAGLRVLGGNWAQALPSSLPVLLATSLSLPPAVASNLDETVPMVGVLLSREHATEPDFVLGMHVVSGAELVASLTLGDGAKFRRMELGPRLVRLLPAPGAPDFNGALGVSGNYLLLATGVDALRDAGRFVAEGVSKRARTQPGLTLRATETVLAGALSKRLRDAWQARRAVLTDRDRAERDAKGRAPDFADPEVLLAGIDGTIESWLDVLESSHELSLSVTPRPDRLRAELSLAPKADGAAALLARELVVGPLTPLLQLPAGAKAALLLRGDDKPAAPGAGVADAVSKLFGQRLNVEQTKRLVKALDALSAARHGATTFGLLQAPVPALVITCELSDSAAFPGALSDVLSLVELPAVSSWLNATTGKPTLEFAKPTEGMHHAKVRFQRSAQGPGSALPKSLSLTWEARDGIARIVVSPSDALGFAPFAAPAELGASSWLTRDPQTLAERASLGVFADARLFAPGGPDDAPILLSFGKNGEQIAVSLDVSANALPAVARLFALDRSP